MKSAVLRLVVTSAWVCLVLAGMTTRAAAASWGWKKATTPDDVVKFLNGQSPFNQPPVVEARITAARQGNQIDFLVFYQPGKPGKAGAWAWKKSTTPDDAMDFLNGKAPYQHPVANAEIAAVKTGTTVDFFIFYVAGTSNGLGKWGWKKSEVPDDAVSFLNGAGPYKHAVSTARVVSDGTATPVFYVFYQQPFTAGTITSWAWKKSVNADDAQHFVNGQSPYPKPVPDFEISAALANPAAEIFTFYNHGTRLFIEGPLANERFVVKEPVNLQALITSHAIVDESLLHWTSSIAGALGSGLNVHVSGLPLGNQNIQAGGLSLTQTVPVRVFTDLGALYQAQPAPEELARINAAFTLNYLDGTQPDEHWSAYDPPAFDQSSILPSKLVVLARLDVMRHQAFSQPLPFGGGLTVCENFHKYVSNVHLRLDCNLADGGGGTVELNRLGSEWWNLMQPDCKTPAPNPPLALYINPLYLLVHEGRHNEPGDPGHTTCNGQTNMDATLDNGSGHAWAALYTMWVYKYGLYDSPAMKLEAKTVATSLLKTRFCTTPTSTNPAVQAIVTELLQ
jgi:hypothetical protein